MSGELPSDVNPYQIEPQLSAYAPRPARIDRDRLMFEAGHAAAASHPAASAALALRPGVIAWFPPPSPQAASPASWLWPASTLALALISVGLGLGLLLRPAPPERVQVVHVPVHAPQAAPQPLAVSSGGIADRVAPGPLAAEEAPAIALDSLPEDHFLRLRQTALTQEVDEGLSTPAGRETARLLPPPTRGELMRQLEARPAAAATRSSWSGWSLWLSPSPKPGF